MKTMRSKYQAEKLKKETMQAEVSKKKVRKLKCGDARAPT